MSDIVITGVGMVTPLGATAKETALAWHKGLAAVKRPIQVAGMPLDEVRIPVLPEIDAPGRLGGRRMMKFMSGTAILGCLAAKEALQEAQVKDRIPPERIGIFAGVGISAYELNDLSNMISESLDENGCFSSRLLGERGLDSTNPLIAFKALPNMTPCIISLMEKIKGPSYVFTPWEGQTGAAFSEALTALMTEEVDCALVGGADNAGHPSVFFFLKQSGILGKHEFPASAAAFLVLERSQIGNRERIRSYAHLSHVRLLSVEREVQDPLAHRMGRTFAAAPAVLCCLTAMNRGGLVNLCGVDQQEIIMYLDGE